MAMSHHREIEKVANTGDTVNSESELELEKTMNDVHLHINGAEHKDARRALDLDEHSHETKWKRRRLLLICALGIIVCHFTLGLLQENMYVIAA